MNFNPGKCSVLTITRKKTLVSTEYSMLDTKLKYYDHHPYLGMEIAQDMDWEENTLRLWSPRPTGSWTSSAEIYLAVLERPITPWSDQSGNMRVWYGNHIDILEKVQHKAARFVCSDYSRYFSVSGMMSMLDWRSLQERRFISRLGIFLPGTSPSDAMYHPTIHPDDANQNKDLSWPLSICHLRSTWTQV